MSRSSNQTEIHVQLKGVHLCCGGCTDAVETAVASVPGAACRCDMEKGTVALAAADHATAQKALDAIAHAGLYGETGDEHLTVSPQSDLPQGQVRRLHVSGIHNCCDLCYEAIKDAINTVEGVTGDTGTPGETHFEVTGYFSPAELIQALHGAGFHAKVTER